MGSLCCYFLEHQTMNQLETLTNIETRGLQSQYNFADAHAAQELTDAQKNIVQSMPALWREAQNSKVKDLERHFLFAFARLAKTNALIDYDHYRIAPTASNSIDMVAAWLSFKSMTTYLLEPTFDNLYLLLKRRDVSLLPIAECELINAKIIPAKSALFIVNPNNPTGFYLTEYQFKKIVDECLTNKITLILDHTFRFFIEQTVDHYAILLDSGVNFICIEDTGKVWPTQDMKASLLIYSSSLAKDIEVIYQELYLSISPFVLQLLTQFLLNSFHAGLNQELWADLQTKRHIFRQTLNGSPLQVVKESCASRISVEWVQCNLYDDYYFANFFASHNIIILPGRNFYWSNPDIGRQYLRFALLKSDQAFFANIKGLRNALQEWQALVC